MVGVSGGGGGGDGAGGGLASPFGFGFLCFLLFEGFCKLFIANILISVHGRRARHYRQAPAQPRGSSPTQDPTLMS